MKLLDNFHSSVTPDRALILSINHSWSNWVFSVTDQYLVVSLLTYHHSNVLLRRIEHIMKDTMKINNRDPAVIAIRSFPRIILICNELLVLLLTVNVI